MNPEQINNCLAFLNRVQLQGNEARAFVEVQQALIQMQLSHQLQQQLVKKTAEKPGDSDE